ncbi:Class I diterpene synthase TPS6, chloroplastic [Sesamum alatum]|uniref:Class I diterpene synthase TPS6, chloroplastic n=1 Tax=Sesamum alatum TaxID=300844 RepID=A0AAE2CV84_9LAMI|nr:Class I diterpene synthase TPS6, chloroplastic [Sesamum alatum]
MLTSFIREMDSWSDETPPSVDDYLSFAWLSISCRSCILTSTHFLGIKLSEDMVMSREFTSLSMHVSFVARLLNDLQTFKKEEEEKKLNSVILMQAAHKDGGGISEEDAIWEIKKIVGIQQEKTAADGLSKKWKHCSPRVQRCLLEDKQDCSLFILKWG